MERECCISRERADRPDYTVEVYKLEKSEEEERVSVSVEYLEAGRTAPEVRGAKSFESRKGK